MPLEKSAGAIIFRKDAGKVFYLLLKYPALSRRDSADYWDLSKGHIEKGEKSEDAAKREAEEETGLKDVKIMEGFKETIKYFFKWEGKNILKFVVFYLAQTQNKDVKISGEHIGYQWLPYEEAVEQLTFKNAKEILKKANLFLVNENV